MRFELRTFPNIAFNTMIYALFSDSVQYRERIFSVIF